MSKTGLGCLLLIVIGPIAIFLRGLVLSQIWAWFVVPLGVTPITLPWALGISTLAYLLTDHANQNEHESDELSAVVRRVMVRVFVTLAAALAFGWLYHVWM